ncbi:unnamed protein product [Chilo suppressalis]|uniref:Lipase n=1 Tax=Chilo suppressalis TaxID=168631 RepID=A0ABN8B545_CHISP|nr:unnamed protein product [Chilo suppressalis]
MAGETTRWTYMPILLLIFASRATCYPKRTNEISIPPSHKFLDFIYTTAKEGYLSVEYPVVTEDGYILRMFRIVEAKNCNRSKLQPPVLLMHGLLESSDVWTDGGPSTGLAYLLSDACFDVWLGNVRGNYYSRRHTILDPDHDLTYWQFTADEMGRYDLPAMVDFVLNNTGSEKLNYVGFSQGGGTFFIMCSERPEYCEKVYVMIALAPATRLLNSRLLSFRVAAQSAALLENDLRSAGVGEVLNRGSLTQKFLVKYCPLNSLTQTLCRNYVTSQDLLHPGSIADDTFDNIFHHFPAGTSLHNLAKYGQGVVSPKFAKFDYGRERNLELYGQINPPEYNLDAVSTPVVIIYGRNDGVVDHQDIKWLIGRLPNVIDVVEVEDPLWNHEDMHYSRYFKSLVFPTVYEHLLVNSY